MQSLQSLVDLLEKNRKIHICVQDLSGILHSEITSLKFESNIHSKNFCDTAKSTSEGYRCCLFCKRCANSRATETKESFIGHCIYGLYEAVVPLVVGGSVQAVIYVGGGVLDRKYTESCIERTSSRTGVKSEKLISLLNDCESLSDGGELYSIAEIVRDYLAMLCERIPYRDRGEHWLVSVMKRHAEQYFTLGTTLTELAALYNKNEKYIGRLFKRECGVSYSEYCTELRLKRAGQMLRQDESSILNIALECGYDNVSYFNRVFKKKYGVSPSEYRRNYRLN